MQTRTRPTTQRPLQAVLSSEAPASTTTTTTTPAHPSSSSALPSPAVARHQASRAVAPLAAEALSSSPPAEPTGHITLQTPSLVADPHCHNSHRVSTPQHTARSSTASSSVPHMPALPVSATTTPTARSSTHHASSPLQQQQQPQPHRTDRPALTSPTAASVAPTAPTVPPARLRSLSNPRSSRQEPTTGDDAPAPGDGGHDGGLPPSSSQQQQQQPQRPSRRHSSDSSSRLPSMLQPGKLTSAPPSATLNASASCTLTSPARMISQPDTSPLAVTSPARRCCLSGGVVEDAERGDCNNRSRHNSTNSDNHSEWRSGRAAGDTQARPRPTPVQNVETRDDGQVGSLPIPSPPPQQQQQPSSLSATHAAAVTSRRSTNDTTSPNSRNSNSSCPHRRRRAVSPEAEKTSSDAYLRENPRVRTLVNNLYQQVLTVQPEDPLHYLAHLVFRTPEVEKKEGEQPTAPDVEEKSEVDAKELEAVPQPTVVLTTAAVAGNNVLPRSGSHGSTYPPSARTTPPATSDVTATTMPHPSIATTTTIAVDARRGSEGDEASTPAPPSAEVLTQQPQPQMRPPLSRSGRPLVTPRTTYPHSGSGGAVDSTAAVVVSARGRSSSVQPHPSRRSSLESGLGSACNPVSTATAGMAPATTTSTTANSCSSDTSNANVNAVTVPGPVISPNVCGAAGAGGTNNNNNNSAMPASSGNSALSTNTNANSSNGGSGGRTLRAPPPSAPTTSLVTRLISAGSPGSAANLRSTLGSGSKLGAPFFLQRSSLNVANGVALGHSIGSGGGTAGLSGHSSSRATVHQASFAGSLSGFERGEATPSEVSSLFSTNSADLQEFIAEFRTAKEECCGGGVECPFITLDELATIMETVAFPFTDAAAVVDLFDELQPCARYLTNAAAAAATPAVVVVDGVSGGAGGVRAIGSGHIRRPRDAASASITATSASIRGSVNNVYSYNNSNNAGAAATAALADGASKLRVSSSNPIAAAAATQRNPSEGNCADMAVACQWQTDEAPSVVMSCDFRRAEATTSIGTTAEDNVATTAAAPATTATTSLAMSSFRELRSGRATATTAASTAEGYAALPLIPTPPLAKTISAESDDRAAAAGGGGANGTPIVPFDTFLARMTFKIQGRYSAEAIRIAFYGMMIDDEVGSAPPVTQSGTGGASEMAITAPTTTTTTSASASAVSAKGICNVLSTDSLTPSEPAGTSTTTLTTLNYVNMPTCTVPLTRCLSEGLYARLGMVDVTASDVQRGVRSAGLPTAPEDQRLCECQLEDFARLVRAVSAVADRGFSVSPANLCLSSLRDSSLPHGSASATNSWKEEPTSAPSKTGSGFPMHTIRYL